MHKKRKNEKEMCSSVESEQPQPQQIPKHNRLILKINKSFKVHLNISICTPNNTPIAQDAQLNQTRRVNE